MSKHRFATLALAAIFFSGSSAALIQNAVATAPIASAHDDHRDRGRDRFTIAQNDQQRRDERHRLERQRLERQRLERQRVAANERRRRLEAQRRAQLERQRHHDRDRDRNHDRH